MNSLIVLFLLLVWVALPGAAAQERPLPANRVVLTVHSPDATVDFDMAMLESLPQHTIATTTDWTEGVMEFQGPLARDVLEAADASGATVLARALNDYSIEIPASDFTNYDVIMALRQNGAVLSRRDKGPIWIVYPRDDNEELQTVEYNSRWIWQLRELTVER